MYFLKNSRCVLRRSQWFPLNVIGRNFRISLVKSRARWPEEDPTKPPLRLNIPKDNPMPGPCNFTPQIQINNPQTSINNEKHSKHWVTPEVQFDEDRTGEISIDQNFSVRSKSNEFLTPLWNADNSLNQPSGKEKKFKLKKTHSYEELSGVNAFREGNAERKRSILTIDVELRDPQVTKAATETSGMESHECVNSDEEIKALAEAIVNEICPNLESVEAKSSDKQDEAFLVIINLADKTENVVTQLSAEWPVQNREFKASSSPTLEDGCYGSQKQVRNLELSDEVERNEYLKELERSRNMRESDTPTVDFQQDSNSESVLGKGVLLSEDLRKERESLKSGSVKMSEEFNGENQTRKAHIEKTIRKIGASGSNFPFGHKMQTADPSNLKMSTVTAGNPSEKVNESGIPEPIAFRIREKNANLSGMEERVADFPERLPIGVTLIDELPELLPQGDNKLLKKSCGEVKLMEDDKFKKSNVIRSYHKSCNNHCKITKDVGEEQPPIVVVDLNNKSGMNSNDEGDKSNPQNNKTDAIHLKKEYSKSKLDNSCDALEKSSQLPDLNGSNDIYLQEESIIDKKSQQTEENTIRKENRNVCYSEKVSNINDERYELDIVDARILTEPVKVPYSAAYPTKGALTGDERTRFEIFRDLSSETFELNVKCLSEDRRMGERPSDDGIVAETSSANGKVEPVPTTTPKIPNNMVNLANEELSESKGAPSVDSLSMMKQVREMVDLDLQNAEKIFMVEDVVAVNDEMKAEEKANSGYSLINPALFRSVVIHNEETSLFYVNAGELEYAANIAKQEATLGSDNLKIFGLNRDLFKGDLAVYVDVPQDLTNQNANYVLKTGDSIIVYDEQTRKWNVNFGLLKEKKEKKEKGQVVNEKGEMSPLEGPREKPQEKVKSKDMYLSAMVLSEMAPILGDKTHYKTIQESDSVEETSEMKRKDGIEAGKEVDTKEIRKKNSDLYDDVITGIKKPKEEEEVSESSKWMKKAYEAEKNPSEHYVSKNILEMSKINTVKPRSNKVETMKLNVTPKARPPSKVTEINLNKKNDEGKGSVKKDSSKGDVGTRKHYQPNGTFYKKFEKYKTPFSDPEYEEKPMKINSDPDSNPNLKKLDSWNKTLVLQEISKSSENVEGWLRNETDKMATLLLKVLQDAADGTSRRRLTGKPFMKGNPYEAIRKKQENNLGPVKGKKREPGRKKVVQLRRFVSNEPVKGGDKKSGDNRSKKSQFPLIEDDSHVEVLAPDSHLPKEPVQVARLPANITTERNTNDIPGPPFLKKLSSFWKYFPDLGCQTTIFLLIRMFQLAKAGLSVFSSEAKVYRNEFFGRLFMKYGPVVKLQGPLSGEVVLINRPEDLNNVFNQGKSFPSRSVLDSIEKCRMLLRQKTFPQESAQSFCGIEWEVIRKSLSDIGSKGYTPYFNTLKSADTMFINRIQGIRNKQKQVPDDFINEVKRWSMEGLCSVLFDKSLGFLENKYPQTHWIAESERLLRHLGEATDHLSQCENSFQTWRFFKTPAMKGLNQAYQALDLIISKYVYQADLTLRKKKKSLLNNSKSIANKDLNFLESMLLNDRMTSEEVTANLIDMLLIGVNTTTVALAFVLYNLAQNHRVQSLLFKEVKDLLPTKTSELNYHQLHSLKYLQACLKESMRLNVPIPFLLRVLPTDIALSNYRVPVGTYVVMDAQTACMKEQVFDDPERFRPERWFDQDCVHMLSSVPFSNGPRAGFVKRITEIQLWTCIAQIVRNYQIEYHFGEIRGSNNVISYPDKPLRLTFIERND